MAESRNPLTGADLVAAGLRANDVVTQYWSALLVKNLPDDEKLKFIYAIIGAKHAWIRLQGLRQLASLDLPAAREHARRLLLSTSSPCRQWAEKLLNLPVEELHVIRRHTLADPSAKLDQKIMAMRLCGESRDGAAKSNTLPFLKHTNPRCRAEALLA